MSNVPRPPTPGKSCCLALPTSRMLHSAQTIASAFPFSVFRGSTPSATAFGPFACLSTLKDSGYPLPSKTNYRRLANLTGRDSHPLYDAAWLGRTVCHQRIPPPPMRNIPRNMGDRTNAITAVAPVYNPKEKVIPSSREMALIMVVRNK